MEKQAYAAASKLRVQDLKKILTDNGLPHPQGLKKDFVECVVKHGLAPKKATRGRGPRQWATAVANREAVRAQVKSICSKASLSACVANKHCRETPGTQLNEKFHGEMSRRFGSLSGKQGFASLVMDMCLIVQKWNDTRLADIKAKATARPGASKGDKRRSTTGRKQEDMKREDERYVDARQHTEGKAQWGMRSVQWPVPHPSAVKFDAESVKEGAGTWLENRNFQRKKARRHDWTQRELKVLSDIFHDADFWQTC